MNGRRSGSFALIRAVPALVSLVALAACGARSALRDELDASLGFDASTFESTAPFDVAPADTGSHVEVTCPAPMRGRQSDVLVVAASASSSRGLALAYGWVVEQRPMGSSSLPMPVDASSTRFALDAGGEWRLRFTAQDASGASGSCTVRLDAQPAIDLVCPGDQSNYQGATARLEVAARSNLGRAYTSAWTVLARPDGSTTAPLPADAPVASLLLDRLGDWRLQYTATDTGGLTASCTTNIHADPDVIVTCPPDIRTAPFATVSLEATGRSRLGLPLTYHWEVAEQPITSTATFRSPRTAATSFTFDVAGSWTFRFSASNARGNHASCTTRAVATSVEAVRVEVVWNTDRSCVGCNGLGGDQDLDLHLADVSRAMGHWAGLAPDDADCFYVNCVCGMPGTLCANEALDWPPAGRVNNPQLDIDHVFDLPGPENVNVVQAQAGKQFDVGVHFYSSHGHSPSTLVVARVYCDGAAVFESEPVRLAEGGSDWRFNNLWRVGRVTVTAGGCRFDRCGAPGGLASCIRPLADW